MGLSVCGRKDMPLLVLGIGIGLSTVADSVYLALYAEGAWPDGTLLDALWPAATIVIALAAWMEHPATVPASARGLRQIAIPAGGGILALAVLVAGEVVDVSPPAALLAVGALLLGDRPLRARRSTRRSAPWRASTCAPRRTRSPTSPTTASSTSGWPPRWTAPAATAGTCPWWCSTSTTSSS